MDSGTHSFPKLFQAAISAAPLQWYHNVAMDESGYKDTLHLQTSNIVTSSATHKHIHMHTWGAGPSAPNTLELKKNSNNNCRSLILFVAQPLEGIMTQHTYTHNTQTLQEGIFSAYSSGCALGELPAWTTDGSWLHHGKTFQRPRLVVRQNIVKVFVGEGRLQSMCNSDLMER